MSMRPANFSKHTDRRWRRSHLLYPDVTPVFTIVRTAAFEIAAPENIVLAGLRPALNYIYRVL